MANQQHLMHESDLPEDIEFVQREPLTTGSAAPPAQQGIDRYQGAILSAPLGLDTDIAKSQLPGANPAYRLMPASIAGNPASNASIQSTAAKTIAVTPGPSSTAVSSEVTLDVPNIFTPITQTVDLPGPLSIALATEPLGTVFNVPPAGLSAIEAINSASLVTGGSGASLATTATPTTATSWGLYAFVGNQIADLTNPSGWTAFLPNPSANGNGGSFTKALSGTSPVSVGVALPTNDTASAVLAIFSGALPSVVQQNSAQPAGTGVITVAFTSNNTAGNTIIVVAGFSGSTSIGPTSLSVSDTAGNVYNTLANQQATGGSNEQTSLLVVIAPNCIGGANSVKVNVGNTPGSGGCRLIQIIEMGPLTAGPQIPIFSPLFSSQIPPISLAGSGNGGITGILRPSHGGSGADLSGTGGAHEFVSQASTGAAFTVVQPDFSDLAGAAGQFPAQYNGIALVSNGLPSEIAKVDLTAQGAAIAATNLIASAPASGMYRVSWVAKVTQAAATPATSVLGGTNGFQITYTDANDSVVIVTPTWWEGGNNGAAPTSAAGNTTGTYIGGSIIINAKIATAIKYQIDYTNGGATPMQYNLHVKLEAL